jgi:hypothetical protein
MSATLGLEGDVADIGEEEDSEGGVGCSEDDASGSRSCEEVNAQKLLKDFENI